MPNTSNTTPQATIKERSTDVQSPTTPVTTKLYIILANGEPIINDDGLITAYAESIALLIIKQLEAVTQGITYSLEYSQTVEANKDSNSMPIAYLDTWDDVPTPSYVNSTNHIKTILTLTEVLEYTADIFHWLQMPDIDLSQIANIAHVALTPVQSAIEAGKNATSEPATPATNNNLQPVFSIHHNGKPLTIRGVTERVAEHIINHLEIIGSRDDVFTTEYIATDELKPVLNPDNVYCVYRHDKPIYTHQTQCLLTENAEYKPIPSYLDKVTAYHVMEHLEALTDDIKHTRDGKTGSTYSVVLVGSVV